MQTATQESQAMKSLQKNIAALLESRGMTQRDLARLANIAPSNLNRLMHGNEKVTLQRAERIAKAFGLSLSNLLDENLSKFVAKVA